MEIEILPMQPEDWPEVKKIYEEGIATKNATFQKEAPSWEEWDKGHLHKCRFVAKEGERILGWAALSPVSGRCVYAGVTEVSIYLAASVRGKGLGSRLLNHLIDESEKNNIWTLQAGIFPENIASIGLHKKCGFREVGLREKLGEMDGVWRDVVLLERRSRRVGV